MRVRASLRPVVRITRACLADTSGATAIEYGLIVGLIAVALIAALTGLSSAMNNKFNTISTTLNNGR